MWFFLLTTKKLGRSIHQFVIKKGLKNKLFDFFDRFGPILFNNEGVNWSIFIVTLDQDQDKNAVKVAPFINGFLPKTILFVAENTWLSGVAISHLSFVTVKKWTLLRLLFNATRAQKPTECSCTFSIKVLATLHKRGL